jgi:epsilon-lactone hydrolase
MRGEQGG